MTEMFDGRRVEAILQAHYQDLQRLADQERLVREALARGERKPGIRVRMMIRLGQRLETWGQRRPRRLAAHRQIQSFPVARQPH